MQLELPLVDDAKGKEPHRLLAIPSSLIIWIGHGVAGYQALGMSPRGHYWWPPSLSESIQA
ncbi:hypothetical protein [Cupriavidus pauculus]|uniref:hypothetical protein n=1 Tax=Cupriavidus pauculus TaxID=82633 RepID=UPI0011AED807|nr:hypothetical protein [Cupriavidus pauculus]